MIWFKIWNRLQSQNITKPSDIYKTKNVSENQGQENKTSRLFSDKWPFPDTWPIYPNNLKVRILSGKEIEVTWSDWLTVVISNPKKISIDWVYLFTHGSIPGKLRP